MPMPKYPLERTARRFRDGTSIVVYALDGRDYVAAVRGLICLHNGKVSRRTVYTQSRVEFPQNTSSAFGASTVIDRRYVHGTVLHANPAKSPIFISDGETDDLVRAVAYQT